MRNGSYSKDILIVQVIEYIINVVFLARNKKILPDRFKSVLGT